MVFPVLDEIRAGTPIRGRGAGLGTHNAHDSFPRIDTSTAPESVFASLHMPSTLVNLVHCAAAAAFALASTNLPAGCNAPTYAIHKPRGVLSITGADTASADVPPRRTLTDLMVAAGLKPLSGHIGRLDLETGGLILVTGDGLLLEAALGVPGAKSLRFKIGIKGKENGCVDNVEAPCKPLPKTYKLLLAGKHRHDATAIENLRAPLTHSRGGKEYHSDGATVRYLRCFQSGELATEYSLLDCHDDDDAINVESRRDAILAKLERPVRSRKTGALVRPFIPFDGWLTEVEVTIRQGRHHQIRRLCKRAGFKLRHLRRVSFGPIELGLMGPGDVRVLGLEEKAKLYGACVPYLEGAHERRIQAMVAARDSPT